MTTHFDMILAGLPRHREVSELEQELARMKAHGYTGIWLENDYVTDRAGEESSDKAFPGNWQLLDLFDFTHGTERALYEKYLDQLCDLCGRLDLEFYVSFWIPRLMPKTKAFLLKHHPKAIGLSEHIGGGSCESLCTCEAGDGLEFISSMVEQFLRRFPKVKGLKVATEDNAALLCESTCPNAKGSDRAQHAANLFACIQQGMERAETDARLLLYPWFWKEEFKDQVLARLSGDFLVVTKMEQHARQTIEGGPGEELFDSSIVAEKTGRQFDQWKQRVGEARLIDMVPVGTGIDAFFIANPPYPGRLYRRLQLLAQQGVRKFLDFECGGHSAGACEEVVSIVASNGTAMTELEVLNQVARRMYRNRDAQVLAIRGWQAFDQGFGCLPIGLNNTGHYGFSGRIGFSWSLCIATPILPGWFCGERGHQIHWFSPYNFFHGNLARRFQEHFGKVFGLWTQAADDLIAAAESEGWAETSAREANAAKAHVTSIASVLNWCEAALLPDDAATLTDKLATIMTREMEVTRQFQAMSDREPWLWANNCWHPHRTPLSQRGVYCAEKVSNTFTAKLKTMQLNLEMKDEQDAIKTRSYINA